MRKRPWLWAGLLVIGTPECVVPPCVNAEPETRPAETSVAQPATGTTAAPKPGVSTPVLPGNFKYLGAFRLPGGSDRPATFAYGGNAATFRPDGDPSGARDGFPGSLFVMGHDRLAYGELPHGNQVAEVDIPVPVVSHDPQALNEARFLQPFRDAAQGLFTEYEELPRVGMQYLDAPVTGPKIHLAWGQHFHEDPNQQGPTHAWIEPDLSQPKPQGTWRVGNESHYAVNGYLFEIPATWADRHVAGRCLATGRYRDGGWSGKGPALVAYPPGPTRKARPPRLTRGSKRLCCCVTRVHATRTM